MNVLGMFWGCVSDVLRMFNDVLGMLMDVLGMGW